jgi:hypothetical protein
MITFFGKSSQMSALLIDNNAEMGAVRGNS